MIWLLLLLRIFGQSLMPKLPKTLTQKKNSIKLQKSSANNQKLQPKEQKERSLQKVQRAKSLLNYQFLKNQNMMEKLMYFLLYIILDFQLNKSKYYEKEVFLSLGLQRSYQIIQKSSIMLSLIQKNLKNCSNSKKKLLRSIQKEKLLLNILQHYH